MKCLSAPAEISLHWPEHQDPGSTKGSYYIAKCQRANLGLSGTVAECPSKSTGDNGYRHQKRIQSLFSIYQIFPKNIQIIIHKIVFEYPSVYHFSTKNNPAEEARLSYTFQIYEAYQFPRPALTGEWYWTPCWSAQASLETS